MTRISLTVGDKTFHAALDHNPTTQKLLENLPITISMTDLHHNEKYYTFDTLFPTQQEAIQTIQSGDLMLYGSDTLVLFYEDFSTPYTYTRLGRLLDNTGLRETLGHGDVTITINKDI
ncbi:MULTISPECIES: cyclophilin-like fold protein [unclassified Staphylococcus]|uniref:cyclophilin-like fold protein n=1 Tax=unclassified Staphylococcus TaxID=91994 RepID=UPI0021CEEAA0|nr:MULTISPECIES: cyclophilin-like fold protein [unclassified Staphylococcus]UXR78276.1 cyclophilin-like fold protein [Staphylococcus sp. IVB6227]UXR82440.1 cyclophilin-like fold protein [Staphylococcus sp. IVB6214]